MSPAYLFHALCPLFCALFGHPCANSEFITRYCDGAQSTGQMRVSFLAIQRFHGHPKVSRLLLGFTATPRAAYRLKIVQGAP